MVHEGRHAARGAELDGTSTVEEHIEAHAQHEARSYVTQGLFLFDMIQAGRSAEVQAVVQRDPFMGEVVGLLTDGQAQATQDGADLQESRARAYQAAIAAVLPNLRQSYAKHARRDWDALVVAGLRSPAPAT